MWSQRRHVCAQTYWDGFDPKAQSFATWAPAFYDEALAAADAEIRWLSGLLPDQVGLGGVPAITQLIHNHRLPLRSSRHSAAVQHHYQRRLDLGW